MKKSAPEEEEEEPSYVVTKEMFSSLEYAPTADEEALLADVISETVTSSGQHHFTVNTESRLGQAIAKRNPTLYPSRGEVTVHEITLRDTISRCVAASSIDRMKNLFDDE